MAEKTVTCPSCGAEVSLCEEYDTQFCPYCGGRLSVPQSSRQEEPVRQQQEPKSILQEEPIWQPPKQTGSGPITNSAAPKRIHRTMGGWIAAIIAWAAAWTILLYLMEEVMSYMTPSIGIALLLLASFPFWFPRFHPKAGVKKGTYLTWMILMLLIMAAAWFAVEAFA